MDFGIGDASDATGYDRIRAEYTEKLNRIQTLLASSQTKWTTRHLRNEKDND